MAGTAGRARAQRIDLGVKMSATQLPPPDPTDPAALATYRRLMVRNGVIRHGRFVPIQTAAERQWLAEFTPAMKAADKRRREEERLERRRRQRGEA